MLILCRIEQAKKIQQTASRVQSVGVFAVSTEQERVQSPHHQVGGPETAHVSSHQRDGDHHHVGRPPGEGHQEVQGPFCEMLEVGLRCYGDTFLSEI